MTYDLRLVRDSSLLGDTIRTWYSNDILVTYLISSVLSSGEVLPLGEVLPSGEVL